MSDAIIIEISVGGGQIVGSRELQEDAFLIKQLEGPNLSVAPTLLIVADGVGGQYGGNIASRLVVKLFADEIISQFKSTGERAIRDVCSRALARANRTMAAAKARDPKLLPMGSTLVAALILDDKLWWVSVGDSYLYVVRNSDLETKNARHTYGAYLDAQAKLGNAVPPASLRERKQLTSSLDGEEIPLVDFPDSPMSLQQGDVIILASDGLDAISEAKIVFAAVNADSAEGCTTQLLDAVKAIDHPKQDNTTVVVLRYGSVPKQTSVSTDADFSQTLQLFR
jgi:PPM family protein phosphatase